MPSEDRENFKNDFPSMPPEKMERRRVFVERSLARFISTVNTLSKQNNSVSCFLLDDDKHNQAALSAQIVRFYDSCRRILSGLVVHGEENGLTGRNKIDRHKIIAGKQAAVMTLLPLRIKKYRSISDEELDGWYRKHGQDRLILNPKSLPEEDTPFVQTIFTNAHFAFSLGVDILCTWNALEWKAPGFVASCGALCTCYSRLLLNTFRNRSGNPRDLSGNPAHDASFFWCSHLWFALERNLLYWSQCGPPVTNPAHSA